MPGYIAHYNGKKHELYAPTLYAAKLAAVSHFNPPRSKAHLVSVMLTELNGEPVVHTPDF